MPIDIRLAEIPSPAGLTLAAHLAELAGSARDARTSRSDGDEAKGATGFGARATAALAQ